MSGPTKIEWANAVWNPVTGCTKVSEGCRNCYAEPMAKRLAGRAGYPAENPFAVTLHPERLDEPLHWRKPQRILVCSMGDLFHPDVPDEFIDRVFAVMTLCFEHTFLLLTKRPERMSEYVLGVHDDDKELQRWMNAVPEGFPCAAVAIEDRDWPVANLWLGTSIEDQASADERIPRLLRCPAAKRFVSYEPALGPVDFGKLPHDPGGDTVAGSDRQLFIDALRGYWHNDHQARLDWVIAGGESGPGARPAHPDCFRSVRDQCLAAGVPFFFKQWGDWCPENHLSTEGVAKKPRYSYPWNRHEWDYKTGLNPSWRVGKKAAGRLLDGVEHNTYPGEVAPL